MLAELVAAPEAALDISEGYFWYEARRSGLGEEFLSCVEACVDGIRRNPEIHATVYETYRRALVRRFPYAVFYHYTAGRVTLFAVFHTARNPSIWRHRLP